MRSHLWPWRSLYLVIRFLQGARRVRLGPDVGMYSDHGGEMVFGGACPIQGEGEFDGHPCYFRSRGERWSFEVFDPDDLELMMKSIWFYEEREFFWPDGGHLHPDEIRKRIEKALDSWRAQRKGLT